MQITLDVPNDLKNLSWKEKKEIVLKAYKTFEKSPTKEGVSSQWARIAEEIDNDSDLDDPAFQKAWQNVKESMKEVREGFF